MRIQRIRSGLEPELQLKEAVKPAMAAEPLPVAPTVISAQPGPILLNTVTQGNCLDLLPRVASGSVDMVMCDLPYGTTQNKWDAIVPCARLWEQYRRIVKDSGAIVLTCQGLFTATLILAARDIYRYSLVWEKTKAGGFLNAKRMPLQAHEDILVFYRALPTYNPQMEAGKPYTKKAVTDGDGKNYGKFSRAGTVAVNEGTRYPRSVIKVSNDNHGSLHPTQKPVALWEYLIRTYTNEGDTVLDNCCGSGTTGVACQNTGRNFIQFELSPEYCEIARSRLMDMALGLPESGSMIEERRFALATKRLCGNLTRRNLRPNQFPVIKATAQDLNSVTCQ